MNDQAVLVGARDASASLGVCVRTVWRLVEEKKLRCVRIGRRVLFSRRELEAFVRRLEKQHSRA